jgi:hypothetical protein
LGGRVVKKVEQQVLAFLTNSLGLSRRSSFLERVLDSLLKVSFLFIWIVRSFNLLDVTL